MISIRDFTKLARGKKIFDRFSYEIPSRGITVIRGRSGSGKTTLLDAIAYERSFHGTIAIDGVVYRSNEAFQERKIAYCSRKSDLMNSWTVYDNISYALHLIGAEETGLDDYLRRYGLISYKYDQVSSLSQGQRMLVKAIRTMMSGASYLLFDEVTADLDGEVKRILLEDIKTLSGQCGIIIASHDLAVFECQDRSVDLNRIEKIKPSEEPIESYRKKRMKTETRPFVRTSPFLFLFFILSCVCSGIFSLSQSVRWIYDYDIVSLSENEVRLVSENGLTYPLSLEIINQAISECPDIEEFCRRDTSERNRFTYRGVTDIRIPLEKERVHQENLIFRYDSVVGRDGTKVLDDEEVMISSTVYDQLIRVGKTMGADLSDLSQLRYFGRPIVGVFESDLFEVNMTHLCHERLDIKKEDRTILCPKKDETQKALFLYTEDATDAMDYLRSVINRLDISVSAEDFVLTEGTERIYVRDEEVLEKLTNSCQSSFYAHQLSYRPWKEEMRLVSGSVPKSDTEVVIPKFYDNDAIRGRFLTSGYTVCGYYDAPFYCYEPYVTVYMSPEGYYKQSFRQGSDFVIECRDVDSVKKYFAELGISAVSCERRDRAGLKTDDLFFGLCSFAVAGIGFALYLGIDFMIEKRFLHVSLLLGKQKRTLIREEMRKHLKTATLGFILPLTVLFLLFELFALYSHLSLMYPLAVLWGLGFGIAGLLLMSLLHLMLLKGLRLKD